MKICPKCGTENLDESKFCRKCGSNLSASGGKKKKKVGMILLICGAAFLMVLGVAAGLFFFISSRNTNKRDSETSKGANSSEAESKTEPSTEDEGVVWVAHGQYLLPDGTENAWNGKSSDLYKKSSLTEISLSDVDQIDNALYKVLTQKEVKYLYAMQHFFIIFNNTFWISFQFQ